MYVEGVSAEALLYGEKILPRYWLESSAMLSGGFNNLEMFNEPWKHNPALNAEPKEYTCSHFTINYEETRWTTICMSLPRQKKKKKKKKTEQPGLCTNKGTPRQIMNPLKKKEEKTFWEQKGATKRGNEEKVKEFISTDEIPSNAFYHGQTRY